MYQISEVLNLIFDSVGLVITLRLLGSGFIPKFYYLILGFFCVWLSNIFTVIEGIFFPCIFLIFSNISFYFLSAILFLVSLKKEILVFSR